MHQNYVVLTSAPHNIVQLTMDFEALEGDTIYIRSLNYVNHISCTCISQEANHCQGERTLANPH